MATRMERRARISRGRTRGDAILRRTGTKEMRMRIELLLLRLLLLLVLLHHLVAAGGRWCQLRLLLRIVVAWGAALVAIVGEVLLGLLQMLMLLLLLQLQVGLVLLRSKVAAGVGRRRGGGAVAVVGIGMWMVVVRVVAVHAAYVHHIVQPEPHFLATPI